MILNKYPYPRFIHPVRLLYGAALTYLAPASTPALFYLVLTLLYSAPGLSPNVFQPLNVKDPKPSQFTRLPKQPTHR